MPGGSEDKDGGQGRCRYQWYTNTTHWLCLLTDTVYSQYGVLTKFILKRGLILVGRCRIVGMICVGSLNYASEEEEEEEEEGRKEERKKERKKKKKKGKTKQKTDEEKTVVEEENKKEDEKNTTKKRINKMYNKKLCPSVEHLVDFVYVLYWLLCEMRVTEGDSGSCCCVHATSCDCWLTPFVCFMSLSGKNVLTPSRSNYIQWHFIHSTSIKSG